MDLSKNHEPGSQRSPYVRVRLLMSLMAALAWGTGCGSDANADGSDGDKGDGSADGADGDGNPDETPDGDGGEDGSDGGDDPEQTPLYAVTTQVFGADEADTESFVILTDSLTPGKATTLDTDGTVIPGRALGTGPLDEGVLFVAGDADPTITRYDLTDDGKLAKGETLSLLGKGLAAIGEYGGQFHYVSKDKAYFFDGSTAQLIIWNPTDMTVTDGVALPALLRDGETLTFSGGPIALEGKVVTFAGFREGPTVPSVAAVLSVDTKTDAPTVVIDERCGYVRDGILGEDGLIYLATEAYGSSVHRLNAANAAEPCMLRFDPATNKFNPDFKVALGTLFEGATAGSLIPGPDGAAYLLVLDETAFTIAEDTHPRVLASATAWQWARVTLGDTPSAERLDTPLTGGSIVYLGLGEAVYAPIFTGRDSTAFSAITADGLGASTLSVPGLAFSAAKLR